jgi:SAM-dependent methyltransferase
MNEFSCPICSETVFSARQVLPGLQILKCSECDLLLSRIDASLEPKGGWDVLADLSLNCALRKTRILQACVIHDLVSRHSYFDQRGLWLDIGCGLGEMLQRAREHGYQIIGVEPDLTAYREAQVLLGNSIHLGIMTDDIVPDTTVDIVSTLDVLEHIPPSELSTFAQLIRRKLKPGGLWVIKVPSTEGLYFAITNCLQKLGVPFIQRAITRLWQLDYVYPHTVYFKQSNLA